MTGEVWIGLCAVGFIMLVIEILIVKYMIKQRQKFQKEDNSNRMIANYRQEVLESQVEVQKQAFERVGSELYDNIGQMLSVAKMYLYSLEETELNQEQRTFIQQTNDIVGKSITDLRGLIRRLEGCMAQDFDLQDCIGQYLQRFRRNHHVTTELVVTGTSYPLEYEKEIVLFRVIQEVVTVIFKRAKVSHLTVKLNYESDPLKIVVESDGQALPEEADESLQNFGWRDIQRRIKLIGGKCTFENKINGGTKVTIEKKV
jgi:signal transduction histidine kinase